MDPVAARGARELLDLAFHMSNILDTGLDWHTLSILTTLCDLGVNPEALAALVKELRKEPPLTKTASSAPSAGLDPHILSILTTLCDLGVNPEALAALVELQKEPPPTRTTSSIA